MSAFRPMVATRGFSWLTPDSRVKTAVTLEDRSATTALLFPQHVVQVESSRTNRPAARIARPCGPTQPHANGRASIRHSARTEDDASIPRVRTNCRWYTILKQSNLISHRRVSIASIQVCYCLEKSTLVSKKHPARNLRGMAARRRAALTLSRSRDLSRDRPSLFNWKAGIVHWRSHGEEITLTYDFEGR
jgi:hypothetical protein